MLPIGLRVDVRMGEEEDGDGKPGAGRNGSENEEDDTPKIPA